MLTATSTTIRTALAALPDCFLHCLNQKAPVRSQQRARQPLQELHRLQLQNLHSFSALFKPKYLSLHTSGMSTTDPRTALWNAGLLHSLHSVDERNLRHIHGHDEGLLEFELHDHRDSKPEPWRLSPAQYLYPALGWRRAAQTEPVLPATPRFARLRLQKRSQGSSAHPPTVPPAAAREERRGAGPRPEERPWAHRQPAQRTTVDDLQDIHH